MSYREENGQVVLTMNAEDYERVLFRLGSWLPRLSGQPLEDELLLINRLNEGNPNWRPYLVEGKS